MRTGLQTHQAVNSRWQEVTAGELPGDKEEASLTQGPQARTQSHPCVGRNLSTKPKTSQGQENSAGARDSTRSCLGFNLDKISFGEGEGCFFLNYRFLKTTSFGFLFAERCPVRLTSSLAPASPWTDLIESQPDAGASSQHSQ